jgi:hypothetical protein
VSLRPALFLPLLPGCLLFAEEPTSIKLLEPEPTLSFVAPEDGSLVNGSVEIEVSASSTLEIARGELQIDQRVVDDMSDGRLAFTWDTLEEPRGDFEIVAWVMDEVDRRADAGVEVTVDQLPGVSFADPDAGDVLTGDVDVEIEAEDDDAIDLVELFADGELVNDDDRAPYTFPVDTCDLPSGDVELEAVATDSEGQTRSATVAVSVRQDLYARIERSAIATVPDDQILADVAWDQGVAEVRFEVDGEVVATFDAPSGAACSSGCPGRCRTFASDWDTRDLTEGAHTITVVLTDVSGETVTDTHAVRTDWDLDDDGDRHEGYGGTDCNDNQPAVHPGATEACNGIDDDCNDEIDETFDGDGDGWAGAASCAEAYRVDCDDADTSIHPGATDTCGNGIDDDCDGGEVSCRDTGKVTVGTEATAWWDGASADDLVGWTVGAAGDLDADGVPDLLIGSPDGDTSSTSPPKGLMYVVPGDAVGSQPLPGAARAVIEGTVADSNLGSATAPLGDVDGDGYDDFLLSEPINGSGYGRIFRGPVTSSLTPASAWGSLTIGGSYAGWDLSAGDVDGDGDTDALLGRNNSSSSANAGLFRGPLKAGTDTSSDVTISATASGTFLGYSATIVRDTDGDGRDDILLGAPRDDLATTDGGAAYVFLDPPNGAMNTSDADASVRGTSGGSEFGIRVASAGDSDGDGYARS